ncbi:MAG: hypothetical protein JO040_14405 [Gemmatimonadetes bacterium]|nr:hypothetical protein [Gemmatimonadota bacterium]
MNAAPPDRADLPADDAPAASGRSTRDRAFGVVAAVAILLALFFLVRGGSDTGASGGVAAPPTLVIVSPTDGATVSGAFPVVFRSGGELRQTPAGWTLAGRYHLHAGVDETELMAGPRDVQPLGNGRYRWTVPALPAGGHRLVLRWAGPSHAPLRTGESEPVVITSR